MDRSFSERYKMDWENEENDKLMPVFVDVQINIIYNFSR